MTCEDLLHSDCQACHANSESCNVRLALNLYNESGIGQTFIIINLALRVKVVRRNCSFRCRRSRKSNPFPPRANPHDLDFFTTAFPTIASTSRYYDHLKWIGQPPAEVVGCTSGSCGIANVSAIKVWPQSSCRIQ